MRTYVVIGLGRFGEALANKLCRLGNEVMAIDKDESRVQAIADNVTQAVACDAKDEQSLRTLGVRSYDCAIVAIGDNIADSVLITLALKELGVKHIVAKAMDLNHKKILLKIGADRVVIPEQESGNKLATMLTSGNVLDYIQLSDKYSVAELVVPGSWVGKSILSLDVRRRYRVNIIGVKNESRMDVAPLPQYEFAAEDIVLVVGETDDINSIQRKK